MRDTCIFYRSFYDAISTLPESEQNAMFRAVFDMSFDMKEPQLEGVSRTIFMLLKPIIQANIKNYQNGTKPKRKRTGSEQEAKPKRKGSQTEGNKDKNKDVNNNKDKNEDKNKSFESFWELYGKKIQRSDCLKKWMRLNEQEHEKILINVPLYVQAYKDIQFRCNPLTYLNGERWNDVLTQRQRPTMQIDESNNQW